MNPDTSKNDRRNERWNERGDERQALKQGIEFFVDADIIAADTVDISEAGIRIETNTPITIRFRMEVDGALRDREAQLVWSRQKSDDGMVYGLKFVPLPDEEGF